MSTKPTKAKKIKKEYKKETKADEKATVEEELESPVFLVTRVNTILQLIFSSVEVYISGQQIYNSIGLYAQKSYISNNFEGAIPEYKGVLRCQVYD